MRNNFEEMLDTIDASIFSGDSLECKDNRELLKHFIDRWSRELATFKEEDNQDGRRRNL